MDELAEEIKAMFPGRFTTAEATPFEHCFSDLKNPEHHIGAAAGDTNILRGDATKAEGGTRMTPEAEDVTTEVSTDPIVAGGIDMRDTPQYVVENSCHESDEVIDAFPMLNLKRGRVDFRKYFDEGDDEYEDSVTDADFIASEEDLEDFEDSDEDEDEEMVLEKADLGEDDGPTGKTASLIVLDGATAKAVSCDAKKYSKPSRPCPFCGKFMKNLTRHFKQVHDNENCPCVKDILAKERNGEITAKDRMLEFSLLRKEGLINENRKMLNAGEQNLPCERRSKSHEKVICNICKGIFAKAYFFHHMKRFNSSVGEAKEKKAVKQEDYFRLETSSSKFTDPNWKNVIGNMQEDEVKATVMKDDDIKQVGYNILKSRKPNKLKDAIIKARTAMRRLARLCNCCGCALRDLFKVEKLSLMEDSIDSMADEKPGLKVALGALIKQSCKILIPHFVCADQRDISARIREFQEVFSSSIVYAKNFATAEFQLKERRLHENRKPVALPNENEYERLITYLEERAKEKWESEVSASTFIEQRRVLHALLTLSNGRRGNEVSQIKVKEWEERYSWMSNNNHSGIDKELLEKYVVLFVMGKNDRALPIFVPRFCEHGLNRMADTKTRKSAGVSNGNQYLFPYTQESKFQVTGYNEIKKVCEDLKISVVSATANRHRMSTKLWQLEVSDEQVTSFMDHIGHSVNIDKNVYACPLPLQAARKVTPLLEIINQKQNKVENENLSEEYQMCEIASEDKCRAKKRILEETDSDDSSTNRRSQKKKKSAVSKERISWTKEATMEVKAKFEDYITGKINNCYPGKAEIEDFVLATKSDFLKKIPWSAIKTKVFNEKKELARKMKKMER